LEKHFSVQPIVNKAESLNLIAYIEITSPFYQKNVAGQTQHPADTGQ
jgi:hypothetical protein